MQNRSAIIIGAIGLILTVIGVTDWLTTDQASYIISESDTVNYYLLIGIPLLILSIVALVRQNRK